MRAALRRWKSFPAVDSWKADSILEDACIVLVRRNVNCKVMRIVAEAAPRCRRFCKTTFYLKATVKASANVDNEGLIGRAREDHRFGFRRANIFRQYQADLGLLLAATGAQQRHDPKHFSFAIPRSQRS